MKNIHPHEGRWPKAVVLALVLLSLLPPAVNAYTGPLEVTGDLGVSFQATGFNENGNPTGYSLVGVNLADIQLNVAEEDQLSAAAMFLTTGESLN
ncbi:MAG: hypothetical protein WC003_11540 [Terrimicrobiaceae bacterium]